VSRKIIGLSAAATIGCLGVGNASADADDWAVSGFVRQEISAKTTNKGNINNLASDSFNGVTVPNTSFLVAPGSTLTRPASAKIDSTFNQFDTRLELNLDGKLTENLSAHFKLRGINDQIGRVEKAFRNVDLYQQPFSGSNGTPFESAGKSWMLDLPVAYVDYSNGPFWLRFGNQQIAWGEAIFFRVSDQVNGLDLRRHSVLGPAAEEFSDTRVPSLALRANYRLSEGWDVDAFTKRFQPTILGNPNSPYNPIFAAFIVDQETEYKKVKNNWDFGAKLRGTFGGYGATAFAIRRNNPDGVFSWTQAQNSGNGPVLPGSAFNIGNGKGVFSAQEWFSYSSHVRLDGLGALETALNEFPGTTALGGNFLAAGCGAPNAGVGTVQVNQASASCILDSFFTGHDLQGWIKREYPKENVFGGSVNHVFEGAPDSLMDQLIGRFEFSYTPNKKFTNPTLSQHYLKRDETQFSFVTEKYHKFSSDVPATYFVLEWLHKSASDLFGRALEGSDNTPGSRPKGIGGGSNYVALAFQQPSPTLEWRFDFTALTDLEGGWLLQPGTRWKPNKNMQFDFYVNYIDSTSSSKTKKNFAQGLEYANEVSVRASYSF